MIEETPPWELNEGEDEEDDDWFFKSITAYSHLLMYNLPLLPEELVINKAGNQLALSGINPRAVDKTEISIYRLPSKLLCQTEQEQGLNNSRDFKILGGVLVDHPVSGLQFIRREPCNFYTEQDDTGCEEELAVSLRGCRNLEVWRLREEQDDLVPQYKIETALIPTSWQISGQKLVLTDGKRVELIDLKTRNQIFIIPLAGVQTDQVKVAILGDRIYLGGSSGTLFCYDIESGNLIHSTDFSQSISSGCTKTWSWDIAPRFVAESALIAINQSGEFFSVSEDLKSLAALERLQSGGIMVTNKSRNRFAVHSGQLIKVYDVKDDQIEPVFLHEGHATSKSKDRRVSKCFFHPWLEDTIISADVDRNLQIWQFNRK